MASSRGVRLVTLGWQTWSFLAVVLGLVLAAALFVLAWSASW